MGPGPEPAAVGGQAPSGDANPLLQLTARLQPWLRDLVRRAYVQPELSAYDTSECRSMLLRSHGLEVPDETPEPEELTAAHVPPTTTRTLPVTLNSVGQLQAVNRLKADQTLRFAST